MILRPFQKAALEYFEKNDSAHVLCIAPTGSGKSLIYERLAQTEKRVLLISPLVALARQQFKNLQQKNIPVGLRGAGRNDPPPAQGVWILNPESLEFAQSFLKTWRPNLLVVDECHCVWEWGESFRPAFLKIQKLFSFIQFKKSLWLSATLPFEYKQQLEHFFKKSFYSIGGFDLPPKLSLKILRLPLSQRLNYLMSQVKQASETQIIFFQTRMLADRMGRLFQTTGKKSIVYHAGFSQEERQNMEYLVSLKKIDLILATSAFGMGMDYPHIRNVILWQAPFSILSCVQMIGRVCRVQDQESYATILWEEEDFYSVLQWLPSSKKDLQNCWNFFKSQECRRVYLKKYFDQECVLDCGRCDVCKSRSINSAISKT